MKSQSSTFGSNIGFLILLVITIAGLDQISKILVVRYLAEGELIPILPNIFNLTLTYNRGAAFGFLGAIESDLLRNSLLWSATIFAVIAVIYMFFYEYKSNGIARFGLALVMGGAVGNCIDRASLGKVVDFLDFYYKSYHWPAFNLADSAICVGVGVLLFFPGKSKKSNKNQALDLGDSGASGEEYNSEDSKKVDFAELESRESTNLEQKRELIQEKPTQNIKNSDLVTNNSGVVHPDGEANIIGDQSRDKTEELTPKKVAHKKVNPSGIIALMQK